MITPAAIRARRLELLWRTFHDFHAARIATAETELLLAARRRSNLYALVWVEELKGATAAFDALRVEMRAHKITLPRLATRAHARASGPATSVEAANAITPDTIRESQISVLCALRECGPAHDYRWMRFYADHRVARCWPTQSRSGLQTRRCELVRAGLVVDAGTRALIEESKRTATEWAVTPTGAGYLKSL